MTDLGSQFVAALAAKDTDRLVALFAPKVDFRVLTPGRFWAADSPQRVVDEVLYQWFEPHDVIERVDLCAVIGKSRKPQQSPFGLIGDADFRERPGSAAERRTWAR